MHLMLIYFDLFVILTTRVYYTYMFPMENEIIDKVYHELRDLVKMKTTNLVGNKTRKEFRNETNSNETIPSANLNLTSHHFDPIETSDKMGNKSRETDQLLKLNKNSSDVVNDGSNATTSSFSKSISLANSTDASGNSTNYDVTGNKAGDISTSKQTNKLLASLKALQDTNNTNSSVQEKGEQTSNSSSKSSHLNKRHTSHKDENIDVIVNQIKDVLPGRMRRKTMQSVHLTNEINDILPATNEEEEKRLPIRIKRKTEERSLLDGELTNEIEDILPFLKRNQLDSQAIRTKRKIDDDHLLDGELTNEIEDILPFEKGKEREKRKSETEDGELTDEIEDLLTNNRDNEDVYSVRTKRKSDESSIIIDRAKTNEISSELTDEIQDIQAAQRRESVGRVLNEGTNGAGNRPFWKTQPSFQPHPDDVPNFANNHMHHDSHYNEEHNQHRIPNNHSIHPEENEHSYHHDRGQSGHLNNIDAHHHNDHEGHHQEHDHEHDHHNEYHQEHGQHQHNEDHRKEHWSSYHHGKYHHVKVKLHGPGKTPSEWALQEQQEMAENPGVIYDAGTYHDVGMDAGFYLMRCEDCIT